jgi:hypothetical protein
MGGESIHGISFPPSRRFTALCVYLTQIAQVVGNRAQPQPRLVVAEVMAAKPGQLHRRREPTPLGSRFCGASPAENAKRICPRKGVIEVVATFDLKAETRILTWFATVRLCRCRDSLSISYCSRRWKGAGNSSGLIHFRPVNPKCLAPSLVPAMEIYVFRVNPQVSTYTRRDLVDGEGADAGNWFNAVLQQHNYIGEGMAFFQSA